MSRGGQGRDLGHPSKMKEPGKVREVKRRLKEDKDKEPQDWRVFIQRGRSVYKYSSMV